MSLEPELFYVNTKISEPSKLSPELFTSWYNDIHIPDIFMTSGIKQAFRYYTTADDPNSVDRPYLALYPVNKPGYLQSTEFREIPVTSDMLPGPRHMIFDVADFDTRYYSLKSAIQPFDGPFLLTDDPIPDFQSAASYRCYFAMQIPKAPEESEPSMSPANLALVWCKSQIELDKAAESLSAFGKVAKFKLTKDFMAKE